MLLARPIKPVFKIDDIRDQNVCYVDKQGVVMLQFCKALGVHKYDTENWKMFQLSPKDISLIVPEIDEGNSKINLYHDPGKGKESEGQIRKSLNISKWEKGWTWT